MSRHLLAGALLCAILAPSATSQVIHRHPTPAELARVIEQLTFEARVKHASTRARVAKDRLKRITTRLAKLERRVDGWVKEIGAPYRGLSGRLRSLQSKTRSVRNSTMRRRYGSLIADVRRKIAQREEWITAAERERAKLELERVAGLATIAESERLLERRKCDKSETP